MALVEIYTTSPTLTFTLTRTRTVSPSSPSPSPSPSFSPQRAETAKATKKRQAKEGGPGASQSQYTAHRGPLVIIEDAEYHDTHRSAVEGYTIVLLLSTFYHFLPSHDFLLVPT